jgi:hypothetical protein
LFDPLFVGPKAAGNGGSAVDLAGLTNGKLYGIRVPEFPISPSDGKSREPTGSLPLSATVGKYGPFRFELRIVNGDGDVRNLPQVENVSDSAGVSMCRLLKLAAFHML